MATALKPEVEALIQKRLESGPGISGRRGRMDVAAAA